MRRTRQRLAIALVGLAGGLAGCGTEAPTTPANDPPQVLARIVINYRAVNLSIAAPYDTVQLVATALDSAGHPIAGMPAPTFRVGALGDSIYVDVTDDGLVRGLIPRTGVRVIARLADSVDPDIVASDTVMINVNTTATPPVLNLLSIHPLSPADTLLPLPSSVLVTTLLTNAGIPLPGKPPTRLLDAADQAIPGLQVYYESLDTAVATVHRSSGALALKTPGRFRLVAQTYAYGVAKADTVALTVTQPLAMEAWVRHGGNGLPVFQTAAGATLGALTVAPGAIVMWANAIGDSVDVTFDDSTNVTAAPGALCTLVGSVDHCGTGNISLVANPDTTSSSSYSSTVRFRQFSMPGTYPYHTRTGASGQIVVGY